MSLLLHLGKSVACKTAAQLGSRWAGRAFVSATLPLLEKRTMKIPTQDDIVEWTVQPGQAVKRGDVIAKVETDRGPVDIHADLSGVVTKYLTTDDAIEEGAEFYEIDIDSEAKPFAHLVDDGESKKAKTYTDEDMGCNWIMVRNCTGKDLSLAALTHQAHFDLKKRVEQLGDGDAVQEQFESEMDKLQQDEKMSAFLLNNKKYARVQYPESSSDAYVTAFERHGGKNKYFFINLVAPCARKYSIVGESHEQFPGIQSN